MASQKNPLQGFCPLPFLQAEQFRNDTGFITGRFCQPFGPEVTCCLPCPSTDWLYPDNFKIITEAASWVNVASLTCTLFLLLSFICLPVEKTHRHYLSICLAIAVSIMSLGFIVPLAAKPQQCINEITPNDMHSSRTCAISGAFLLAGGWAGVMWVFMRALALHLQICWQRVMGKPFMYGALVGGWGIPAVALTIALAFSGVSFRFGDTCHINHKNSLADFWIPLLVFAGLTVIIQFGTFGYCIKVYLASLSDNSTTTNSSGLPSYTNSIITLSPKQAYRRVRRVVELQWRGITIVLLIITDVIFFSVVFVFMDNSETAVANDKDKSLDWTLCLVKFKGDKNKCLDLAQHLVVGEATVMAVLLLLSLNGIWLLLLLGRFSMFTGWFDLVKDRVKPNKEFVSADAARAAYSKDPRSYEMLAGSGKDRDSSKTSDVVLTPISPVAKSGRETPDYFGREAKYHNPQHSFSSPQPPQGRTWNESSTRSPTSPPARDWTQMRAPTDEYRNTRIDPLSMNKI